MATGPLAPGGLHSIPLGTHVQSGNQQASKYCGARREMISKHRSPGSLWWLATKLTEKGAPMRQKFAILVRTSRTTLVLALLAVLGGFASAVAAHAQSTSTSSLKMVRGYQATTSTTSVTLMTIPGLGTVKVDCLSGLSRIAFCPSVSGSHCGSHMKARPGSPAAAPAHSSPTNRRMT